MNVIVLRDTLNIIEIVMNSVLIKNLYYAIRFIIYYLENQVNFGSCEKCSNFIKNCDICKIYLYNN